MAGPRGGPTKGLLTEADGVLQAEAPHVGAPQHAQVRRPGAAGLEVMAQEAAEHVRERHDKPWPSHKNKAVGAPTQHLGKLHHSFWR